MELNRGNMKKILLLIAFGVLLLVGALHLDVVLGILGKGLGLLTPFVLGCALAFIMNVPMRVIEEKLMAPINRRGFRWWERARRGISLVLTILFILGLIFILLFIIVPEIVRTGRLIAQTLPGQLEQFFSWLEGWLVSLQVPADFFADWDIDWNKVVSVVGDSLKTGGTAMLNTTVEITTSIVGGVANLFLAVVFSIYLLLQKERLAQQAKNAMIAFLPERRVEAILSVGQLANRTFSKFVSGQCAEAVILGVLCFVGMSVFSMPYAMMISALVGVTALIPVFGAFIGAGVGSFLILMVEPMTAVWFLVFLVVLQQLEGNLIYPKVVGKSVGLPGIWVLMAVTVGGSLGGVTGILLSVPTCSVIYALFRRMVRERLREKGKPVPLTDEELVTPPARKALEQPDGSEKTE